MSEHPNVALMRRAVAAFSTGDLAALQEIIAPDCVWHVPGKSQVSGTYRGHAEIFGYFGRLMELTGGTFRPIVNDVTASDAHAVNLERLTAERDGRRLDVGLCLIVRVREGRMAEVWDYFDDQYAWDEFFS